MHIKQGLTYVDQAGQELVEFSLTLPPGIKSIHHQALLIFEILYLKLLRIFSLKFSLVNLSFYGLRVSLYNRLAWNF